jgi:hypothetical protein
MADTRKIGQSAFLNGKRVVWDGKGWQGGVSSVAGGPVRKTSQSSASNEKARNTPPVGQMAVLNGQPVMWKGDRWGTPPSEAMGVPEKANPPVGQMAVLNGQPVMWKGDRWGTPPSEAMGVPEAVTAPRSRSGASGPPPRAPGGQAPVPEVRSGNSQQRVSPVTGQPLGSTTGFGTATPASPFGAGFNPLAATPFDRAALEASIKGEGWANADVVAGTQTDMNGAVKNPFVESQLTMASFGGQQAPTMPAQLSTLFGAAAGMAPLAGEVMTNSQVQMPIDLVLSGPGATTQEVSDVPEEAAQEFVGNELQKLIKARRGMADISQ